MQTDFPSLLPSRHFLRRCWDSLALCDLSCMHAHIDSSISSLHLGAMTARCEGKGRGVGRADDWQGHVRVPYPSPESHILEPIVTVGPVRRCA